MPHASAEDRKRYNKNYKLKYRYGITIEQYEAMVEEQGNRCYICDKHRDEQRWELAVDHCHITGEVRKLLCVRCNALLGEIREFRDDRLTRMFNYVKEHSDGPTSTTD